MKPRVVLEGVVCGLVVAAAAGGLAAYIFVLNNGVTANSLADSLFFRTTTPARSASCDRKSEREWICNLGLQGGGRPIEYLVSVDEERCWRAVSNDPSEVDQALSGCIH